MLIAVAKGLSSILQTGAADDCEIVGYSFDQTERLLIRVITASQKTAISQIRQAFRLIIPS
jgi:hypothetical protein